MKILIFEKDKEAGNISQKTEMIGKLIIYLIETKDESLLKDTQIEKLEIYDKVFIKVYTKDLPMMVFDYSKIEWLKTHHYIHTAKYAKEEAEKVTKNIESQFIEEEINI